MFTNGTGFGTIPANLLGYGSSMLGNLGYSSLQCVNMPADVGALSISCPYGTIGSITQLGIGNQEVERLDGSAPNPVDICFVNFQN